MESERVKPPGMCIADPPAALAVAQLNALGYLVREATDKDLEAILAFQRQWWPFAASSLETPGQLVRLVVHGLVLLLEDEDRLIGVNLNEHWTDGTQYGVRNIIDSGYTRQRLGALLPLAAAEIGLARGLRVRRAIVSPLNPAAATNLFNHVGFIADGFRLHYPGETAPFSPTLPLDQLYQTQINAQQLRRYCEDVPARVRLIDRLDVHALDALYQETPWRVVAALPDHFVAVSPTST
jgi:hypothetical protein